MTRSHGLRNRENVHVDRPEWAAADVPPHRTPLPLVTREAVARPESQLTNERLTRVNHTRNDDKWASPKIADLREKGSAIRRETLRDLEGYLERLTRSVEANGGQVHRAATPEGAREIIGAIARRHEVGLAVKSKSMVSEEIALTPYLEERGVEVVETDLGEYIVQLADERPAHIIGPALHKSRADVHRMFSELAGEDLPGEAEKLTAFARERLREDFHTADMGISGVNFAAADTGTLVLVTNEGNGRMVTSQPRVHVAVMTVEKVIPRLADLGVLIPLLSHSATSQKVSGYQTMVTGPRRAGEPDGPEELHLVILDNGRTEVAKGKYAEALACVRCGACQLACPVFRTLGGGHGYDSVYGGPIGAVLTPLIGDREKGADLPYLSSLCGACADVCPVKIPLPDMLVDLRADYANGTGPGRRTSRLGWSLWSRLWSSPVTYRLSVAGARTAARVPGLVRTLARASALGRGWARGRVLPPLRRAGEARRRFGRNHDR